MSTTATRSPRRRTRTSSRPLTLGQLESFFNGAWSVFEVLKRNFGDEGYDLTRDAMLRDQRRIAVLPDDRSALPAADRDVGRRATSGIGA